MRAGCVLQVWCCLFLFATAQSRNEDPGVIAESRFYANEKPDGWFLKGGQAHFKEAPGRFVHALSAFSNGPTAWDFCAPKKFLGNVVKAYGGVLRFQFGFATHTGKELDRASMWGVRLQSESAGLELGAHVRLGHNEIPLLESNWVVLKGSGKGHSPTHNQMLLTLTKLSGLLIRGSYYVDSQLSWIDDVQLKSGDHNVDHLHKRVKKHVKSDVREKVGVGMVLGYTTVNVRGSEKRMLTVKRVVDGGPAQTSAVIEAGDLVYEVDGVGMGEMSLKAAAEHISGEAGSSVSLAMMKPSGVRYFETLTRAAIDPELASEALDRQDKKAKRRKIEQEEQARVEAAKQAEEDARRRKEEELLAEQERQRREQERMRQEAAEALRRMEEAAQEAATRKREEEKLKKERDQMQRDQIAREKEMARRRAADAELQRQKDEKERAKAEAEALAEREEEVETEGEEKDGEGKDKKGEPEGHQEKGEEKDGEGEEMKGEEEGHQEKGEEKGGEGEEKKGEHEGHQEKGEEKDGEGEAKKGEQEGQQDKVEEKKREQEGHQEKVERLEQEEEERHGVDEERNEL